VAPVSIILEKGLKRQLGYHLMTYKYKEPESKTQLKKFTLVAGFNSLTSVSGEDFHFLWMTDGEKISKIY